jgi:hypothetical protein
MLPMLATTMSPALRQLEPSAVDSRQLPRSRSLQPWQGQ